MSEQRPLPVSPPGSLPKTGSIPIGPPRLHPPAGSPAAPAGPAKIATLPTNRPAEADLDPIGLVEESPTTEAAPVSKIRAFGVAGGHHSKERVRKTNVTGHGACRVRTFHGRLSDEGMAFMDDKINEWLDQNPDIEIKIVTTNIGTFEGKIREPALVVNVWY